jgi:peptidoglycan/LPS O-acetylase OafA/YrhL
MSRGRAVEGSYLPTLDGWRAAAILLVMLGHAADGVWAALGGAADAPTAFKRCGLLGVQIFFGLSGLLITSRLLEEERRDGRISLKGFYVRRFFRIMPAAYTFLLVAGAAALAGLLALPLSAWLSALLCYANYNPLQTSWYTGHFWSLSVEEHFYLLWPPLFLLLAPGLKRRVSFVLGLALLVALWRAADFKYMISGPYNPWTFWGRTDICADGLLWGVVAGLLHAHERSRSLLRRALASRALWLGLAAFVVAASFVTIPGWKTRFAVLSLKAAVIPALLLGTLLFPERRLGRVLESPPLRWIGRLSYSLYLWQQLFFVWRTDLAPALGPLQALPWNVLGAFACAAASHYFVEKPFVRLGHRLAARIRPNEPQGAILPLPARADPVDLSNP